MAQSFSGNNRDQRPGQGGAREQTPARSGRDAPPAIDVSAVVFGDKLAATLFADIAEHAAEAISRARQEQNKASQLRRFYDELVMWQDKVGSDAARFQEAEPYIRMLKAKVAYAKGRGHIDDNFETLFRHVIDQTRDAATLRQAKFFMEAFMAFYKVHRK